MSRQKSNRTLLLEQERAARMEERKRKREEKERDRRIREERRQQKATEQQAKREGRMKRQLVHESVERNGVPKVQPEESRFGMREAMTYDPHAICGRCHMTIRESELYGIYCERCHYKKEVNEPKEEELKAEVNRAVPGTEDGGKNGSSAPAGQLTLEL